MSFSKALRGSCHCGRNQYVVQIPSDPLESAQIVFDSDSVHRLSQANPLSAFLRVPLSWYQSRTFAFFPDETRPMIRRIFSHPAEQHTIRQFCGFCGTPLSYWSEEPRSEAEYIQLTLGSLLTEDLHDLEELGLLPDEADNLPEAMDIVTTPGAGAQTLLVGRETTNIPWFDTMLQGSRLGTMRTSKGIRESQDGRVRVEWEITEWTGDDDDEASESSTTGKRKRDQDGSEPKIV